MARKPKDENKRVDHYKATEELNEAACKKYCEGLADHDIQHFKPLTFNRDKLVSGYMGMYYRPKRAKKEETKTEEKI